MGNETKGAIKAMRRLEEVAREAGRAEDPGLRDAFERLPRAPLRLICCALDKGINHGNVLRIAECFRLQEVCFAPVGRQKERDFSGGFAALKWQPHRWVEPVEAIRQAKKEGAAVYGMTLKDVSKPLRTVEWRRPAAIVLGRELEGLDPDAEAECDELVAIPLFGMVQSLNVAVSAALAVESWFDAFRRAHPEFEPARGVSKRLVAPQEA